MSKREPERVRAEGWFCPSLGAPPSSFPGPFLARPPSLPEHFSLTVCWVLTLGLSSQAGDMESMRLPFMACFQKDRSSFSLASLCFL